MDKYDVDVAYILKYKFVGFLHLGYVLRSLKITGIHAPHKSKCSNANRGVPSKHVTCPEPRDEVLVHS